MRDAGLRPSATDGILGAVDSAIESATDSGNFEGDRGFFLRDVASGETVDTLIETIERGEEIFFVVVRDVELQAKAKAGRFKSALPSAFGAEDGVRFAAGDSGSFTTEGDRNLYATLTPGTFEGLMARSELAFEAGASVGNFEADSAVRIFYGGSVDAIDSLVETIELGMELAVGGFGEVKEHVDGGVARFQCAGPVSFESGEWASDGRGGCLGVGWVGQENPKQS